MASQMAAAVYNTMAVTIDAEGYTFKANGQSIKFKGFMTLYVEGTDEKEEIEDLERKHKEKPELREAAKTLAYEVVKFVHGVEAANNAKKTSEEIFSNGGISANMPSITIDIKNIENKNILDLLVLTDIASSKSEARRLVTQGGISLNKEKVLEPNTIIDKTLFNDNSLIIQKGKKTFLKVNLKDS